MNLDTGMLSSLALALGLGLLIGLDRERSKGAGPTRRFAGIRTFSLTALTGAAVQLLEQPWLVAVAGALVAGLALVAHLKDRSADPGVTTEIALFVTFLLGMFCVTEPALAAAFGVVVAGLLAARVPLQRFSTQILSQQELRDALVLAGAALIILPLAPRQPLSWLGGMHLHAVWLLVVVIMVVQAMGHVALRLVGSRLGLPLAGLVAGFVSSTATIAAMGARAAKHPELRAACLAGAWFSNVSTALQVLLIALVLHPAAVWQLAPAMGSALLVAVALGAVAFSRSGEAPHDGKVKGRAFSLRHSIGLALLFMGITAVVGWLQGAFGVRATFAASALAGFADMHAPSAAVISLLHAGGTDALGMQTAVLLAFSTNTASKIVAAYVAGGARFGSRVAPGLLAVALAGWLPLGWSRLLA